MIALLCALLSGGLFYSAYGLDAAWMLAWFAPAPLLWLAYDDKVPRWQVVAACFAAAVAGNVYFFQAYGTFVLASALGILAGSFVMLAAAVLLSAQARRTLPPVAALFAFPVLWTGMEFLESLVSPHGSWNAMGYSQVDWPAAIQLAALTGVYGVTFLLCLFANALAMAARGDRLAGGLGVALSVLAIAGGYVRLAMPEGAPVRVAAMADVSARGSNDSDLVIAGRYAAAIRAEAARGTQIFVTPETGLESDALGPVAAAARDTGRLVVAGAHSSTPQRNMTVSYVPGAAPVYYDKRHRLFPDEAKYAPGTKSGFIGNGMAATICKDLDFPGTIRGDAQAGIRLMLVPANDFFLDDWMHARQAVMRGVENGFAMGRTAFHGLATISDDRGRILALGRIGKAGFKVAVADVPLGSGPTLYTRFGDWFAWLCVVLAVALAGAVALRRRGPDGAAVLPQRQYA